MENIRIEKNNEDEFTIQHINIIRDSLLNFHQGQVDSE